MGCLVNSRQPPKTSNIYLAREYDRGGFSVLSNAVAPRSTHTISLSEPNAFSLQRQNLGPGYSWGASVRSPTERAHDRGRMIYDCFGGHHHPNDNDRFSSPASNHYPPRIKRHYILLSWIRFEGASLVFCDLTEKRALPMSKRVLLPPLIFHLIVIVH